MNELTGKDAGTGDPMDIRPIDPGYVTGLAVTAPTETGVPARGARLERRLTHLENWGRIVWLMLRGILGWRFAGALVILVGVGYYLASREMFEPASAHTLLGRLFTVFALILAAPLLPDERSRGTLEILWMACGSLRRLLRWKTGVLVLGVGICSLPALWAADWYLEGELNVTLELVFLLTQTALIAAWTFYVGSFLPQPWAGGLVASATLLALEWPLAARGGVINPFFQIYASSYQPIGPGVFIGNRIFVLVLAWFFYDQAARRVRGWLK